MKKVSIITFLLIFVTSCYVNIPSYYISGTNERFSKNVNQSKWIVYFDNFSADVEQDVQSQIISDFQDIFQNKVEFAYNSLGIDKYGLLGDKLNEEDLENIQNVTNSELLALFKIQMKYQAQDKLFSIKKVENEKYRNMFIFLDVYDLQTKELIYTKYSVSQLKTDNFDEYLGQTGIRTQAIKTYKKLRKDFINFINTK